MHHYFSHQETGFGLSDSADQSDYLSSGMYTFVSWRVFFLIVGRKEKAQSWPFSVKVISQLFLFVFWVYEIHLFVLVETAQSEALCFAVSICFSQNPKNAQLFSIHFSIFCIFFCLQGVTKIAMGMLVHPPASTVRQIKQWYDQCSQIHPTHSAMERLGPTTSEPHLQTVWIRYYLIGYLMTQALDCMWASLSRWGFLYITFLFHHYHYPHRTRASKFQCSLSWAAPTQQQFLSVLPCIPTSCLPWPTFALYSCFIPLQYLSCNIFTECPRVQWAFFCKCQFSTEVPPVRNSSYQMWFYIKVLWYFLGMCW